MNDALGLLKRAIVLALAAAGLSAVGCGGVVWSAMARNNRLVAEWEDALWRYPLPPNADLLEFSGSQFGLLMGNGNHCDIQVALVLLTQLSASEVRDYYEASGLAERLGPTRRGLVEFPVWIRGDPWPDGRSVVRVELFGHGGNMGNEGGFDPRCH